jgi:hypothetical protein
VIVYTDKKVYYKIITVKDGFVYIDILNSKFELIDKAVITKNDFNNMKLKKVKDNELAKIFLLKGE